MPIYHSTVKYYTCKYKCGSKKMQKSHMEYHEKELCFCNPKNKACRLCKHFERENIDYSQQIRCKIKDFAYEIRDKGKVYDYTFSIEKWDEQNIMLNRPFPTKNCDCFELKKK